eukprot:g4552.t1
MRANLKTEERMLAKLSNKSLNLEDEINLATEKKERISFILEEVQEKRRTILDTFQCGLKRDMAANEIELNRMKDAKRDLRDSERELALRAKKLSDAIAYADETRMRLNRIRSQRNRASETLVKLCRMQELPRDRAESLWNEIVTRETRVLESSQNGIAMDVAASSVISNESAANAMPLWAPDEPNFEERETRALQKSTEKMRDMYEKSATRLFVTERKHVKEMGFRMNKITSVGGELAKRLRASRAGKERRRMRAEDTDEMKARGGAKTTSVDDHERTAKWSLPPEDTERSVPCESDSDDPFEYVDPKDPQRRSHRDLTRKRLCHMKPKTTPADAAHIFAFANFLRRSEDIAIDDDEFTSNRDTYLQASTCASVSPRGRDTDAAVKYTGASFEVPSGAWCSFKCDTLYPPEAPPNGRRRKRRMSLTDIKKRDFANPFVATAREMSDAMDSFDVLATFRAKSKRLKASSGADDDDDENMFFEIQRRLSLRRRSLRRVSLPTLNPSTASPAAASWSWSWSWS